MTPARRGAASGPARGAGRPPRSEKHAAPIAAAEQQIADRLPQIIATLFDLALGVHVERKRADGTIRVYQRVPNYKALEYLANRILGKPPERVEHTGEDGTPMTQYHFYIPTNGRDPLPDGDPPAAGPARDVLINCL